MEYHEFVIQDAANVLTRNNPTYRHAKRFGLVKETGAAIRFHFESPNVNVTGATQLHRGASVLTAGLCSSAPKKGDEKCQ